MQTKELQLKTEINRKRLVEVIFKAKAGHIGGDLSCLNVLTVLYNGIMRIDSSILKDANRDRFVMSKGHCVEVSRVQSETDKRKTLLFLTEKAHALKGEYDSVSDEMGSIYYKGFSEEEITRFEECLDRIRKNLEEWQKS